MRPPSEKVDPGGRYLCGTVSRIVPVRLTRGVAVCARRRETAVVRRTALAAAVFVVHALSAVAPATAGGSWLSPVRDRYEPGEVATLVGYTSGGQLGWVQDGPFFAYLVVGDITLWAEHRLPTDHVALGPLSIQSRGRALRVSISFPVPHHLAAGLYTVTYCNDPCTTGLGDLIGGSVAVGVDPPREVQRGWYLDDPEIANLADDAVLTGPGYDVTAADVRGHGEGGEEPPLGIVLVLLTVVAATAGAAILQRRRAGQTPDDERAHLPSRPPARVGRGE